MASLFAFASDTGRTLYGTIQQVTAGGTLGNIWDNDGFLWSANPSTEKRRIALSEGTGVNIGTYTGGTGTLTGYTGLVVKRIHDANQSYKVIGTQISYLSAGVEQRDTVESDTAAILTQATTAATQSTSAATQARQFASCLSSTSSRRIS